MVFFYTLKGFFNKKFLEKGNISPSFLNYWKDYGLGGAIFPKLIDGGSFPSPNTKANPDCVSAMLH